MHRSTAYYQQKSQFNETDVNLMNIIRGIWQEYPFFGYRKITAILRKMGHTDNHKRVQRLMRAMGIQAIYPKHRTSIANKEHKKTPIPFKKF